MVVAVVFLIKSSSIKDEYVEKRREHCYDATLWLPIIITTVLTRTMKERTKERERLIATYFYRRLLAYTLFCFSRHTTFTGRAIE